MNVLTQARRNKNSEALHILERKLTLDWLTQALLIPIRTVMGHENIGHILEGVWCKVELPGLSYKIRTDGTLVDADAEGTTLPTTDKLNYTLVQASIEAHVAVFGSPMRTAFTFLYDIETREVALGASHCYTHLNKPSNLYEIDAHDVGNFVFIKLPDEPRDTAAWFTKLLNDGLRHWCNSLDPAFEAYRNNKDVSVSGILSMKDFKFNPPVWADDV